MHHSTSYVIPGAPPAEVLAELDAAARALEKLSARAARLTLGIDEQARSLQIEVDEDGRRRRLSPTELFDLLAY